jgi:hypothetical protein
MKACFMEGGRAGSDAKILADVRRQQEDRGSGNWNPEWEPMFEHPPTGQYLRQQTAYDRTMAAFADDLGLARGKGSSTAVGEASGAAEDGG